MVVRETGSDRAIEVDCDIERDSVRQTKKRRDRMRNGVMREMRDRERQTARETK